MTKKTKQKMINWAVHIVHVGNNKFKQNSGRKATWETQV